MVLKEIGGEAGCERLAAEFYARVAKDPALRRLFPGKSLRCATEEFAAFLVQFLGGDEEKTQKRWWLSLRESHARFRIGAAERSAWLRQMKATLDTLPLDPGTCESLGQFFRESSTYVIGNGECRPEHPELAARWAAQRTLDDAIGAIAGGDTERAIRLATQFSARPVVFVGLLARMVQSGHPELLAYAAAAMDRNPSLALRCFGGRTLLHLSAAAGAVELVTRMLQQGADPNVQDRGGHTPLYAVANGCAGDQGPELVRILVRAGADVNASQGVTKATPLHMAARRGYLEIARALLACGARVNVRDSKGVTPLARAVNCRKPLVAQLLSSPSA